MSIDNFQRPPTYEQLEQVIQQLQQQIGDYAPKVHGHQISEVDGLQDQLDAKQSVGNYAIRLVGEPMWLPYAVSGQPWIDANNWLWYQPDGTPISLALGAKFEKLFLTLWLTYPIAEGKGASAQADWDAGKSLQFPDVRGRSILAAGQGAGLTDREVGTTEGKEEHLISINEMPPHAHNETMWTGGTQQKYYVTNSNYYTPGISGSVGVGGNAHAVPYQKMYTGGGQPIPIMSPWVAFSLLLWMGEKI